MRFKRKRKIYEDKRDLYCMLKNITLRFLLN